MDIQELKLECLKLADGDLDLAAKYFSFLSCANQES